MDNKDKRVIRIALGILLGLLALGIGAVCAFRIWARAPELTAQTIHDGVIYMTDLGYISPDGYLYLVGRRDDVINVGGLKIAPTEVEDAALRFEKIAECVCIPFDSPEFGRCVKMYTVLKPGYAFDAGEISAFLESRLEGYKIPKYIEQTEEIPKTFNGKIDRKAIIAASRKLQ